MSDSLDETLGYKALNFHQNLIKRKQPKTAILRQAPHPN